MRADDRAAQVLILLAVVALGVAVHAGAVGTYFAQDDITFLLRAVRHLPHPGLTRLLWIVELMTTALVLGATLMHLRPAPSGPLRTLAATAVLLAALLSKETAIPWLGVMVAVDVLSGHGRTRLGSLVPAGMVTVAFVGYLVAGGIPAAGAAARTPHVLLLPLPAVGWRLDRARGAAGRGPGVVAQPPRRAGRRGRGDARRRASIPRCLQPREALALLVPGVRYRGFASTIPADWLDVECFYYEQRGWLERWGKGAAALRRQARVQRSAARWLAADSTDRRIRALGDSLESGERSDLTPRPRPGSPAMSRAG